MNDLDRFDVRRGDTVESPLRAEPGQARLTAVDEDGDAVAASKQDFPVLIDCDTGQPFQRVEQAASGLCGADVETEHLAVHAGDANGLGGHRHLLLEVLHARQADVAQVMRLVQRADEHVRHGRLETGKSDRDPVLAWRESLHPEAAVLGGERAGQRLSGTREFDDDGGKREWRTRRQPGARVRKRSRCPVRTPRRTVPEL